MVEINSQMIKELREKTGAGMLDCKNALTESSGNFDDAVDWLRKKGLSSAAKKFGRVAAEGVVALNVNNEFNAAAIIELNSETDFAAKNSDFQSLAVKISELVNNLCCTSSTCCSSTKISPESVLENKIGNETIESSIKSLIAVLGENINLRSVECMKISSGVVSTYIHNAISQNLGKTAVIVGIESSGDKQIILDIGKKLAMHIAAADPAYLSESEVPESVISHEKEIFFETVKNSGKPESVITKMVEGRLKKYFEEVVFLNQTFVMDGKKSILEFIHDEEKKLGTSIKVVGFKKIVLGRGVEKKEDNFVSEVMKQAGLN